MFFFGDVPTCACLRNAGKSYSEPYCLNSSSVMPVTHALFSTSLSFKSAADMTVQMRFFSHVAHMCLFKVQGMQPSGGKLSPFIHFHILNICRGKCSEHKLLYKTSLHFFLILKKVLGKMIHDSN